MLSEETKLIPVYLMLSLFADGGRIILSPRHSLVTLSTV